MTEMSSTRYQLRSARYRVLDSLYTRPTGGRHHCDEPACHHGCDRNDCDTSRMTESLCTRTVI